MQLADGLCEQRHDPETNLPYYVSLETGDASWEPPVPQQLQQQWDEAAAEWPAEEGGYVDGAEASGTAHHGEEAPGGEAAVDRGEEGEEEPSGGGLSAAKSKLEAMLKARAQ